MSRKHKRGKDERGKIPQATHWIWAGILGVVAGGVYYSYQTSPPIISNATVGTQVAVTEPASVMTTTSTIQFGVSAPKGDRDQLYVLTLPAKTVEQKTVDKGWRLDTWKNSSSLHIVPASPDGEPPVLTDGGEWKIPLRGANGEPYFEPQIAGFPDDMHVFVIAMTNVKKLLLISRDGEIRSIYDVPDNAIALPSNDDHAWFATFVPGEGIESDPIGPSKLIRVSLSGTQESLAEDTRLITSVIPGPNNALAYRTDNGDVVVTASGQRWSGNGVPLLWFDDNRLLLAQGRGVFMLDMRTLSLELLQQLPSAPSVASVL